MKAYGKPIVVLVFLLGVLWLMQTGDVEAQEQADFSNLQEVFGVHWLPEQELALLYCQTDRGWLGDGQTYSIWQYTGDMKQFFAQGYWRADKPLGNELYQDVLTFLEVEQAYVPLSPEWQRGFSYWQKTDIDGNTDDQLLLLFLPQVTLGNGQEYRRLLFVLEWYS